MLGRKPHHSGRRNARTPVPSEPLEPRRLLSTVLPDGEAASGGSPQVVAVYANGTGWADAFRAGLAEEGDGSARFGAETHIGEIRDESQGSLASRTLPWTGINQVSIQFDEDVNVQQDDLLIDGVRQEYAVTAFAYDPEAFVGTWTLDRAIEADVVVLRLDGDSPTGVTDLEGNPLNGNCSDHGGEGGGGDEGRDFCSGLVVLPGDVIRDGRVNAQDVADVKRRLGSGVTGSVGDRGPGYDPTADVNADGRINALDLAAVKARLASTLPDIEDEEDA